MKSIQDFLQNMDPPFESIEIQTKEIVFEERVKLACFNCPRYGVNHTCPPNIPPVDYVKVVTEYTHALLVWSITPFDENTASTARRESTVSLHRALLDAEKFFYDKSNSLATSFIGGSCKLCSQGCSKESCRQPALSRIPMEASGINVVETCRKHGIRVSFPATESFYRIGLLLW